MSALSPNQRAKLRSLIERFDVAIDRERTRWGAPSAEQMRAKGVGLADINAGLDLGISLRDVHALAERGLVRVETARTSVSGLRRGSFGRWIGGSTQREVVTARVAPTDEGRRQSIAAGVASMADQLWIVFLDGVAQTSLLPFAGSEDNALRLWCEQTNLGPVARDRLRAVPRTTRAIEESHVPHAAAGAPQDQVPSSRPEELSTEEQGALRAWADNHAPRWKAALRLAWETGNYGGSEHDAALQRLRNRLGPSWLGKYRLPVDPSHETKGYRCWVVTSRKPREVDTWVATRRAEAASQVKAAVKNKKTEGGVESKDPRFPYEATFALVRGKLITTDHSA